MYTFCKIHDETIEHIFFDSPVTQRFLTKKNISLVSRQGVFVNLIDIIANSYIFKCKLNEQKLNIVEFKH